MDGKILVKEEEIIEEQQERHGTSADQEPRLHPPPTTQEHNAIEHCDRRRSAPHQHAEIGQDSREG
jgi:hypothetical protein